MAHYFIESPHTKEECLKALDEINEEGPEVLEKFEWACMSGQHIGYGNVDAQDESEARKFVPSFLRSKARVIKVDKFTPQQIQAFHKK